MTASNHRKLVVVADPIMTPFFRGCCRGFGGSSEVTTIDAAQLQVSQPPEAEVLVGPVQQVTATPGKTTLSVRNSLAGLDVESHRSETLESSLGTECTELEFIEGPDGTVRVRGPYDPEIDTAFVKAIVADFENSNSKDNGPSWVGGLAAARWICSVCHIECREQLCPQCGEELRSEGSGVGIVVCSDDLKGIGKLKDHVGVHHEGFLDAALEAASAAVNESHAGDGNYIVGITRSVSDVVPGEVEDAPQGSMELASTPSDLDVASVQAHHKRCCFKVRVAWASAWKRSSMWNHCQSVVLRWERSSSTTVQVSTPPS